MTQHETDGTENQTSTGEDLDNDGFMLELSQWRRELADELAKRNDIGPLGEDHWRIIEYVREYFLEHKIGPPIVKVGRATGLSPKTICDLFPCGMARGAYRLAGLPRPSGCI